MRWSEFEAACEDAGIWVDKRMCLDELLHEATPEKAAAVKEALPPEIAAIFDGSQGLGDTDDVYYCVTGFNPVVYDDGFGGVLTLCTNGRASVEDYGPDVLAADGYPLLGFYQLPVADGQPWRAWVVDCGESRGYMDDNEGNPDLVKLI